MDEMLKSGFEQAFNVKLVQMKVSRKMKPDIQRIYDWLFDYDVPMGSAEEDLLVKILEEMSQDEENFEEVVEPSNGTTMSDLLVRVGLHDQLSTPVPLDVVKDTVNTITGLDILIPTRKREYITAKNSFCFYAVKKLGYSTNEVADYLNMTRSPISRACKNVVDAKLDEFDEYQEILVKLNHEIETYKLENQ